ncbi:MAG: hypothetical protein ABFD52_07215 [Acidobacteriota bacterium]
MKPEPALFLFHLRVGARLALRVLAPVLAVCLFLYYILRPEFSLELARILFVDGSPVESGLAGSVLLLGLARIVVPRIAAGSGGWARSLPARAGMRRLSTVLSVIVAETPMLVVLGGLAGVVAAPDPRRVAIRIAGLLIGAAAAGLAWLPARRYPWMRLVPLAACFFSFAGDTVIVGLAAAVLAISMARPGLDVAPGNRRGPRRSLPARGFFPALALRAVRGPILIAYIPAAAALGAAWLFLRNNDLAARPAFAVSLIGLALALVVFIAVVADVLASRRPAWPWLHSLPRSAAARVRDDALLLAMLALPLAGGLALLGRPAREAVYLAGPLAWLAIRGAAAMRQAADRPFGAFGQVAVEGAILALVIALLPPASFALAAASPVAFVLARNAERRFKPTLWVERHHSGAGDPLSWSAS